MNDIFYVYIRFFNVVNDQRFETIKKKEKNANLGEERYVEKQIRIVLHLRPFFDRISKLHLQTKRYRQNPRLPG